MEKYTALLASSPSARGGAAAQKYAQAMFGDDVKFDAYLDALRIQTDAMKAGDMSGVETMLLTQANTLDLLFNQLARKAAFCEYLNQFQVHLSLALKAQAQSRATLEALAEIKNPRPVAFVKQANIANGPQQVNNSASSTNGTSGDAPSESRTRGKNGETTNELLTDERNGQTMDGGTAGATSRGDPALAAVGKRDGAAH
ncbi:hypothetical protein PQR51_29470 [Caballeronia grimmiae]